MFLRVVSLFLLNLCALAAIELSSATAVSEEAEASTIETSAKVFGYNLFNGSFASNTQFRYNPNYRINIGDTINVKIWGAIEIEAALTVIRRATSSSPRSGRCR